MRSAARRRVTPLDLLKTATQFKTQGEVEKCRGKATQFSKLQWKNVEKYERMQSDVVENIDSIDEHGK